MSTRLLYAKSYAAATLWALFILFATIANVSTLKHLHLSDLFDYDKPIHLTLFGTQAWLLIRGRLRLPFNKYKQTVFLCCFAAVLYGILTEVLQGLLTTTRMFDYYDAIADGVGCLIVYLWYLGKQKQVA